MMAKTRRKDVGIKSNDPNMVSDEDAYEYRQHTIQETMKDAGVKPPLDLGDPDRGYDEYLGRLGF